jgi:hypothetical protein
VNRNDYNVSDIVSPQLKAVEPHVARLVQDSVFSLSERRLVKGGKKSYDIMVGQYFNDMTAVLADIFRVLKSKAAFTLILGDSAPYGVHIPTEHWLGIIGCGLGFGRFTVQQLRTRGDKWRGNAQRHHVGLKESLLTLYK